jgi:carboxyl-terminal processing protease
MGNKRRKGKKTNKKNFVEIGMFPILKVMTKFFFSISALILLLSHGMAASATTTHPDTLALPCRQKAEQLLNQALSFMEKNYYRRDLISWTTLAAQAREQLLHADNCDDAYASITWCFKQLGERHSFIMPPDKAALYNGDETPEGPVNLADLVGEIHGEWLEDSIAYLTIPWVHTTDSLVCERVADSLQTVIARLDSRHVSHWIIDLRNNSGGNCWPMLAGIGPLLGDGVYGYFVASGEQIPISYHDGSACQGRHVICRVSEDHGYHTYAAHKSIVVLTGRQTVSAGEIVALAFKGREQTCLIGQPTAGLTTANATYSLSDRSVLVLTVCQEADFTGHVCDGRIQPDQLVPTADPGISPDAARSAALAWLQSK